MATIKKREGRTGITYKITVAQGSDSSGKQVRHFKTWVPEPNMTERQMEKEAQRVAFEFERQIEQGYVVDDRQTFAEYAEYVLQLKARSGCKSRTIERYYELLERINPAIGHIKLGDIRPRHLNEFYKNLGEAGISKKASRAVAKVDLKSVIKKKKLTKAALAEKAGISPSTVTTVCQNKKIALTTAQAVAKALGENIEKLFLVELNNAVLSNKTITEHHRLIRTILGQAEKEMLVLYNAASKATPPKTEHKEANSFQPSDIERVLAALETEPIKWRTITHLLLISGCRRGEIMGLKWEKVDFKTNQIRIDSSLLYSSKHGIYESTTKTGNVRYIKLPLESMQLLREYRRWYLELHLKNGDRWKDTGYLFVRDDGTPMLPDSITAWLSNFSKRHDLPHINPHAFRHTMASILIKNGKDIVSVSKRLGHAKVSTTTDLYSHVIQEADEESAECLADAMLRKKA